MAPDSISTFPPLIKTSLTYKLRKYAVAGRGELTRNPVSAGDRMEREDTSKARRTIWRDWFQSVGAVFSALRLHVDLSLINRNGVVTDSACWLLCKRYATQFSTRWIRPVVATYRIAINVFKLHSSYTFWQKLYFKWTNRNEFEIEKDNYCRFE